MSLFPGPVPHPEQNGSNSSGFESLYGEDPQFRKLPTSSPARALRLFEYQESIMRAMREGVLEESSLTPSVLPAEQTSRLPLDLTLQREIERLRQNGGGEVTICPHRKECHLDEQAGEEKVTISIYANSDTERLWTRLVQIAQGDLSRIKVAAAPTDTERRYQIIFDTVPLERIQTIDDLRCIADQGSLAGVASAQEWIATVKALYALQPTDLFHLSPDTVRGMTQISEELLCDPRSISIRHLPTSFLRHVPKYQPSWKLVMSGLERQEMQRAQGMFVMLTGGEWKLVSSSDQLLELARRAGQVERVVTSFCTAIAPEDGAAAYKTVLDPLFVSNIPELTDHALHSVALRIQKTQEQINQYITLTLSLAAGPQHDA